MRVWWIVLVAVLAVREAHAGAWYYRWSCSGACAEGRLAIRGVSPGYASKEMCERERWNDSRRHEFIGPGNLGGLTFCEEYDAEPSADGLGSEGRKIPMQRFSLAAIGGPGWTVTDGTMSSTSDLTAGAELHFVGSARPMFGLEASIGVQRTTLSHPRWGADAVPVLIVPLALGLTSNPGIIRARSFELRLDLGADVAFGFRNGCAPCDTDEIPSINTMGMFRAGLDVHLGASRGVGIGLHGVYLLGRFGNRADEFTPSATELEPPSFLLRLGLIFRNNNLFW